MNIPHEAIFEAMSALDDAAYPHVSWDDMRAILESAAPVLLSHEREETRLAHLDGMVNRETKREQLAQAWERGRVDGYHHRPNPYKETK